VPGSRAKRIVELERAKKRAVERALDDGFTPLDVMIMRMRDPAQVSARQFSAAEAAAPYVHPKLSAVAYKKITEGPKLDLSQLTDLQLEALRAILRTVGETLPVAAGVIEHQPQGEGEESGR
jgi:hypothetical protein